MKNNSFLFSFFPCLPFKLSFFSFSFFTLLINFLPFFFFLFFPSFFFVFSHFRLPLTPPHIITSVRHIMAKEQRSCNDATQHHNHQIISCFSYFLNLFLQTIIRRTPIQFYKKHNFSMEMCITHSNSPCLLSLGSI